ncbi:hypothetical protein HYX08_03650 [Candidatus Woesearchaeota archaeon]|nr:hypothetical protein [Candidatus Woesearchaeota archaeon]
MGWYNGTRCTDRRQYNHGRFKRIVLDGEKLQQLYHSGVPIKEIAASFSCSVPTIKRNLKFLIPSQLRRYKFYYSASNPINQRIAQLYTNHHYSTGKIAGLVMYMGAATVRSAFEDVKNRLEGVEGYEDTRIYLAEEALGFAPRLREGVYALMIKPIDTNSHEGDANQEHNHSGL